MITTETHMKNRFLITSGKLAILFVVTMMVAYGCSSQPGNGQGQGGPQDYPVLKLHPQSIELTSSYPAILEGRQTVEIRPRVPGYITDMHVDEGDWVDKGQLLFTLNSEEFEQEVRSAVANVQAAEARVSTANDEVERLKNLVEKEIVSDYQLQSAKNTLESNEASLAQAKARLVNARVNLGYTEIKSPVSGIIGTIPYRIGSLVNSTISRPLTVVSDISRVFAYFSMSERELLEMSQSTTGKGDNTTIQQRIADMPKVNLVLADNSLYPHRGTLKLASGLINTETGSASFRATFPNPEEVLRSGGSGNVQIPFVQDSAIVIPQKSTYEIQNKQFVYTVTDSNTVTSREVSLLPLATEQLYVVESGLSVGDTIISTGTIQLSDGASVNPKSVNADSLYSALGFPKPSHPAKPETD